MNLVAGFAAGAAATFGLWWIASRAAVRRGIALGRLPLAPACAVVAASAALAPSCAGSVLLTGICVAALTDARTGFVFAPLSAALAAGILTCASASGTLPAAVTAGAAIALPLALLYRFTGGRGLGWADVRLGFSIGAGLGAPAGFDALGLAFIAGGAIGALQLALRRATPGTAIPFAPYLALGSFVAASAAR